MQLQSLQKYFIFCFESPRKFSFVTLWIAGILVGLGKWRVFLDGWWELVGFACCWPDMLVSFWGWCSDFGRDFFKGQFYWDSQVSMGKIPEILENPWIYCTFLEYSNQLSYNFSVKIWIKMSVILGDLCIEAVKNTLLFIYEKYRNNVEITVRNFARFWTFFTLWLCLIFRGFFTLSERDRERV